uniref:Uncharacterized protein n=1 Tax=Clastoptera arizonana TaxID=38151 RepID=A0A1B6E2Z0_9HEMI
MNILYYCLFLIILKHYDCRVQKRFGLFGKALNDVQKYPNTTDNCAANTTNTIPKSNWGLNKNNCVTQSSSGKVKNVSDNNTDPEIHNECVEIHFNITNIIHDDNNKSNNPYVVHEISINNASSSVSEDVAEEDTEVVTKSNTLNLSKDEYDSKRKKYKNRKMLNAPIYIII